MPGIAPRGGPGGGGGAGPLVTGPCPNIVPMLGQHLPTLARRWASVLCWIDGLSDNRLEVVLLYQRLDVFSGGGGVKGGGTYLTSGRFSN